jgi:cytochrome c oxidase subunit I+III
MTVSVQRTALADDAVDRVEAAKRDNAVVAWLSTTDHTAIGKRFIATAMTFFALGGILAVIMRLQLARPLGNVVGPDLYNQIFTTHGTTMMFLFAVPVMQGFGLYLVPMMVGAKNLAFPRLALFAWYMFVFGGALLWVSMLTNTGPDAGWFAYVPLAGPEHSPGKRVDVWAQLITFTEVSALAVAVNLIVTIFKHRAPGMSLDRMPMFTWASLVTSWMVVFAMPSIIVASTCLALDRLVGTQFFNHAEGGDPLLWQHLFWFFGHPEVYIIFLPALGFVSHLVVNATKRPLFGYTAVVLANVATAILGFGLWVHHMFATGLPQLGGSFFTGASILIAIPTGVQLFCWIATIWGSRPKWDASFCFVIAFFATFLVGGLTGVMLASVPIDKQVHDTFFVVAHLHYVLIGGAVFPLFGAFYHWLPKMTGRLMSEGAGKLSALLVFIGFNVAFFPQHWLGLHGMPRRIYTYLPETGWGRWNFVSTIGASILGFGILVTAIAFVHALRRGKLAGPDPWGSDSLEWALPSPPTPSPMREVFVVPSRYPMWQGELGKVVGLKSDDLLVTRVVDAEPDHKTHMPGPSIAPFLAAVASGATIVTCIFTPWGLPIGAGLLMIALLLWMWPRGPKEKEKLHEVQP